SQMLQDLSQTVASELDLSFLTSMILDKVTSTMHIDKAAFLLKEEKSGEFLFKAHKGFTDEIDVTLASDHPIIDRLANNPDYLTKRELDTLPQFKGLWEWEKRELERLEAEIFFPLKAKNELVGILVVGPKLSDQGYSTDDHLTLSTLANQIAVSIANARLYAETDELRVFNENIVQSMEEGILLEDENCLVTFVNPKVVDLVGIPSDQLIGNPAPIIIPQQHKTKIEGASAQITRGLASRFEAELETNSEKRIPVIVSTQPLYSADNFSGTLYVLTDITERKQEEENRKRLLERIREQVQLIHQIVDTVPEGVLLLSQHSNIVLANRAANEYLKLLANAKTGDVLSYLGNRPLNDLLGPPPDDGFWHEVQVIPPEGEQDQIAEPSRIFEVTARSMEPGPESAGWVLVIRDVTQERKAQDRIQQQDRLAALGQLAAGIAHDFNNMMVSIILYSDIMLQKTDLEDKDRDRLKTIRKQGQRAVDLTQQILDFSRKSIMNRVNLDLLTFLNEQQSLLVRMLPENIRIRLVSHVPKVMVNADLTRLQQVVMNLAINARDAMPSGGVLTLELDYLHFAADTPYPLNTMPEYKLLGAGHWAKFSVSDNGTGISQDILPHIFEPFFTTKEVGKGTGLGLPQVFGIVKQHGGHVQVESQMGRGTTISIYLTALPLAKLKIEKIAETKIPYGKNELVLLVEDDALTRSTLKESMELLKYRVIDTGNGNEALDVFNQEKDNVSLVISDLVMPEMGGAELSRILRNNYPDIPIIILTGHPLTKDNQWLESEIGANWIQKPVDLDVLAEMLAKSITQGIKSGR
ncbi:MAG: response regulator, partial [Anaerolineales bacterium]|nr:response regulator [Anaerolineales bacterium]